MPMPTVLESHDGLDGGDRVKTRSLKVKVEPAAVAICVPRR